MKFEMNKIYNIDALEFMKQVSDNYFDLVLTDIPYNEVNRDSNGLRYLNKNNADVGVFDISHLTKEICRVSSGTVIMFCGMKQLSYITEVMQNNGLSTRTIVWEKNNPSPMNAQHLFVSGIEVAVYGRKPNGYYDGEYSNTVFKENAGESKVHPTQKPIKLWERLVRKVATKGHKVFDPFMGSGTTAVVCKSLGIDFVGCELEPDYVAIANKRLEAVQGSLF